MQCFFVSTFDVVVGTFDGTDDGIVTVDGGVVDKSLFIRFSISIQCFIGYL